MSAAHPTAPLLSAPSSTRCRSPRNEQLLKRKVIPHRIELEPLPAVAVGGDDERPASPSDKSYHGNVQRHGANSPHTAKPLQKSPKKHYPRLQTIAQLAESHVDSMHTGNFVSRSVTRWREFESQSDNQLTSTGLDASSVKQGDSNGNSTRSMSDDAQRAMALARETGSVVIQCAWRRYTAVSIRKKLMNLIWERQMRVAAWISQHHSSFQNDLERLLGCGLSMEVPYADQPPFSRSLIGMHYHIPATILTMWLRFMCTKASSCFFRRSPAVLQTIDIPVRRTLRVATRCWHKVSDLAATSMQCCVRSFFARKLFRRIRGEYLHFRATLRLQGFFRVCLARKFTLRRRRRRAAISIQCCWRCAQARSIVQQQRIVCVARKFWVAVSSEAVKQAASTMFEVAATIIQRVHRGQKARSRVRWLLSVKEQRNWLKNPSKGFMLFAKQQYGHAALCLEYCRRQGYVDNFRLSVLSELELKPRPDPRRHMQPQQLITGSRMSFSFSSTPANLNFADWFQQNYYRDELTNSVDTVKCLRFWFAYAMSHFHAFDASGAQINLHLSREGWERFLDVCETFASGVGEVIRELRFQAQYHLLLCVFWMCGRNNDECRKALELCNQLIQEIDDGECPESEHEHDLRVRLLMTSCMLSFELGDYSRSCVALQTLFDHRALQSRYSELEVRFILALLLCKQAVKSSSTVSREEITMKAVEHFKRCFQLVELLPGVGFFHGALSSSEAKQRLAHTPVGSFLLHTSVEAASDGGGTHAKPRHADEERQDILLKVKLGERPLRVTALRIKVDADGLYYSKKILQSKHASLHEFIASLPEATGIRMQNIVRKKLFIDALEKKSVYVHGAEGFDILKPEVQQALLSWRDWERQVRREVKSVKTRASSRANETWAAACLHIARALESNEAWIFGLLAAKQAISCSRDRNIRASANFLAARCSFHLQRYSDFQASMRLAQLARGSETFRHRFANLRAVSRALSRNVMISKQESFESQLDRVQKLERMCLKAWRYDSLSVTMRGDPFSEALLLQRIYIEMYSACADTFFLRSLLKAHVRAYLAADTQFEKEHLRKAVQCVAQLFELFREHHGNDGRESRSQLQSFAAFTSHAMTSDRTSTSCKAKTRSGVLSVDHLLLLWHRIPFVVCFELAEALYRSSAASCENSDAEYGYRVIDMYESLYGRLRGAKSASSSYAVFEELILIRLAFLYAQKGASTDGAVRFLRSSVKLVDELLSLRSRRRESSVITHRRSRSKTIKWPRALTLPYSLSDAELVFTRGLFREMLEDTKGASRELRKSWRDYDTLHSHLMATVMHESKVEAARLRSRERTLQPRGIRLYIGHTQDVVIKDLLHSNPCVSVQCEGKTSFSQTSPTWMSLTPSWDEYIEFDVESAKSRLIVSLIDRGKRGIGTRTIGSIQLYISELIAKPDSFMPGKLFMLRTLPFADDADSAREVARYPKLFLGFQVLCKPREATLTDRASAVAHSKRMCGNWKLSDLQANLHGDLETFVRSRWVWSSLGKLWFAEQEYSIASRFFQKAIGAAHEEFSPEPRNHRKQHQPADVRSYIEDLLALTTCYKATMSRVHMAYYAIPLVDRADTALQSAILSGDLSQADPAVQKLVRIIDLEKRSLKINASDSNNSSASEPLADALHRNTPASSDWVKMTTSSASSVSPESVREHFFNLDTEEYFVSHAGASEPLEFEDKEFLRRCNFEKAGQRPHRIVIMNFEMRARVQLHRIDMQQRRVLDPYQWTAVFHVRQQEMRFFSERQSREGGKPNAWNGGRRLSQQQQPQTYVMLADDYMLYNVLLVQDAFRKFRSRRRSGRKLRGIVKCARWFAKELLAARRRIATRIETNRKRGLNCLHIIVERARHLRAGDWFTSDPFVFATVLDHDDNEIAKGKTSVRHNTLNPKWNEEFHFQFDWAEFAARASALESDGSDEDDDAGQCQISIGTLVFEVCDYDIIALRKAEKKPRGDSEISSDDGDGGDSPGGTTEKKGDLLGRASIPIAALEHGEPFRADLLLRQSSPADGNAERARGTLSVFVHWIHSEEFAGVGLRRPSNDIITASKKPLAKQPLPDTLASQLRVIRTHFVTALEQLFDLATTTLDPLQRLHKRMLNAQAVGRTADEAKVVEQRIFALIEANLAPKTRSLDDHTRVCMGKVQQFVQEQELLEMIQEYTDSQLTERSHELTTVLRSVLDGIKSASNDLRQQTGPVCPTTDSNRDLKQLGICFGFVFHQRQVLNTWRQNLDTMLTTFFVGEQETWTPTPLQEQTDEIYSKLEAQPLMKDFVLQATDAKTNGGAGSDSTPQVQSPTKAQSKATVSAEKRMERIQKEKRMERIQKEKRRKQQQRTK